MCFNHDMHQYTLQLCLVKRDMTKSTGDSLPVYDKKLAYTHPTKPFLSTSRRTRAVILRTRAVVLKNEVDLSETRTPPAVVNIYPYS